MKEQLSAVMDGQRADGSSSDLIDRIGMDAELSECWQTYCLIGDALRSEPALGGGVASRVMVALENEPTVLAPSRAVSSEARRRSALDRMLPLAASVMGVAAVGWVAMTMYAEENPTTPTVAAVAALNETPPTIERVATRPGAIDMHREYVFIHQASSRNGPIPGVAQYVRSVSELQAGVTR